MIKQQIFEVKVISAKQTLPLRQKVLKPFLTQEECVNPGDDDSDTYHFGAFLNGELISIATFLPESHVVNTNAKVPYRLRGMASDHQKQKSGAGAAVLLGGMDYLEKNMNCDFVWCNAREVAFGFYQKMGFCFYGDMFDIKDIGPHKVMYKHLKAR